MIGITLAILVINSPTTQQYKHQTVTASKKDKQSWPARRRTNSPVQQDEFMAQQQNEPVTVQLESSSILKKSDLSFFSFVMMPHTNEEVEL